MTTSSPPRPAPPVTATPRPARHAWRDAPVAVRRVIVLAVMVGGWATYVKVAHVSPLVFASPQFTLHSLWRAWSDGQLASATATTLEVLLGGVGIGIIVAAAFTVWSTTTLVGRDVVSLLTAVLFPLPSVAIVPLAIVWFGVSNTAVLFVVAESVVWPLTVNLTSGLSGINPTLAMVGRNLGLRHWSYAGRVMVPAALPSIISGLEIAWAAAWRTAIAAELVFGTAGGNGGIGFYINTSQYFLKIGDVFAGLLTIGIIGIVVQAGFRALERRTIVRWGMVTAS